MSILDTITLQDVEQFLYREARFADDHDYDAWEALWTDDATYWVPFGGDDTDPTKVMSIIFDNRSRISTRVKQLHTGKRHSQTPASRLRRQVSNVELMGEAENGDLIVGSNVFVVESRERGTQLWAGRVIHHLRDTEDGLRMSYKKIMLVDNERPLYTLSFII